MTLRRIHHARRAIDDDHPTSHRDTGGILPAWVIASDAPSVLPPLVVLHGIARNANELAALFRPEAPRTGRCIVVPDFSRHAWPVFRRPGSVTRPDQA